MKKMILLFSHKLTDSQKKFANDNLEVEEYINLPKELQNLWSNISPELESLLEILIPIKKFVVENTNFGDVILIQGDFGGSFIMVEFCKKQGLVPVYATTKRIATEYIDEDGHTIKKSKFEFRRFREYE